MPFSKKGVIPGRSGSLLLKDSLENSEENIFKTEIKQKQPQVPTRQPRFQKPNFDYEVGLTKFALSKFKNTCEKVVVDVEEVPTPKPKRRPIFVGFEV